jgi:hypothetical protein
MRQNKLNQQVEPGEKNRQGIWGHLRPPEAPTFRDAKSSILGISWHFFPSSVIVTFYDLIFVFYTLPVKREYFKIHVHKKCTKLTPEEL